MPDFPLQNMPLGMASVGFGVSLPSAGTGGWTWQVRPPMREGASSPVTTHDWVINNWAKRALAQLLQGSTCGISRADGDERKMEIFFLNH